MELDGQRPIEGAEFSAAPLEATISKLARLVTVEEAGRVSSVVEHPPGSNIMALPDEGAGRPVIPRDNLIIGATKLA